MRRQLAGFVEIGQPLPAVVIIESARTMGIGICYLNPSDLTWRMVSTDAWWHVKDWVYDVDSQELVVTQANQDTGVAEDERIDVHQLAVELNPYATRSSD